MRKLFNRGGFTIIEVLTVCVIIGVIVAIAIPLYNDARTQARQTAHNANVRQLEQVATLYIMGGGTTAIWASAGGDVARETVAGTHEAWYPYLTEWPENPFGGTYVVEIKDGRVSVWPGKGSYGE